MHKLLFFFNIGLRHQKSIREGLSDASRLRTRKHQEPVLERLALVATNGSQVSKRNYRLFLCLFEALLVFLEGLQGLKLTLNIGFVGFRTESTREQVVNILTSMSLV